MERLTAEELPHVLDALGAMPSPECEYLIDGICPCIGMCELTEYWEDCCGCARCCLCGLYYPWLDISVEELRETEEMARRIGNVMAAR